MTFLVQREGLSGDVTGQLEKSFWEVWPSLSIPSYGVNELYELMMECGHLESGGTSPLTLQEEVQDRAPDSQEKLFSPRDMRVLHL